MNKYEVTLADGAIVTAFDTDEMSARDQCEMTRVGMDGRIIAVTGVKLVLTLAGAHAAHAAAKATRVAVVDAYNKGIVDEDAVRIETRKVADALSAWAEIYRQSPYRYRPR